MIGFDDGSESLRTLDETVVDEIHSNLTTAADVTQAHRLNENSGISYKGTCKAGPFDIPEKVAIEWLNIPNPHRKPNSDVLRPWVNGTAILKRPSPEWVIDFGAELSLNVATLYERPFQQVVEKVKPERQKNKRAAYRERWWLHAEPRPGMRKAFGSLPRYLVTSRIAKHLVFVWTDTVTLPDDGTFTLVVTTTTFSELCIRGFTESGL